MGFLGYNNSAVIKDSPDPIGKSEKAHIKGINWNKSNRLEVTASGS